MAPPRSSPRPASISAAVCFPLFGVFDSSTSSGTSIDVGRAPSTASSSTGALISPSTLRRSVRRVTKSTSMRKYSRHSSSLSGFRRSPRWRRVRAAATLPCSSHSHAAAWTQRPALRGWSCRARAKIFESALEEPSCFAKATHSIQRPRSALNFLTERSKMKWIWREHEKLESLPFFTPRRVLRFLMRLSSAVSYSTYLAKSRRSAARRRRRYSKSVRFLISALTSVCERMLWSTSSFSSGTMASMSSCTESAILTGF
mmetsp:Transcript_36505/g.86460  ORF Transcript_36505/g.86460 Transcript_36505/m.86460 type:complete len:258 (+) Transcript_36505:181-954(+)